jgi:hypothetical protein
MSLPDDIQAKITRLFPDRVERAEAERLLSTLFQDPKLTVGPAQLARSILVLCAARVSEIERIILSGFGGDPRDVLVNADATLGYPGHYGNEPFEADS